LKVLVYKKRAKSFVVKIIIVSLLFLVLSVLFAFFGANLSKEENEPSSVGITSDITVVIDAGHGGIDGGAEVNGVFEKDLNLSVSKSVSEFLSLYNVNCVMTRTDDVLLSDADAKKKKQSDLLNRVKLTKSCTNPVFISIHMNKFPLEKYSGLQVFYSVNNPDSELLAEKIQGNVVSALQNDNNRKIKPSGSTIYVLDRLECPSVLVECGFMSNRNELENLLSEEYRQSLAFVIAQSIIEFINEV